MIRKGTLYGEYTSGGRLVRGVGYVRKFRWVAEMSVCGKRYRCRSSSVRSCAAWLDDMREKWSGTPAEAAAMEARAREIRDKHMKKGKQHGNG